MTRFVDPDNSSETTLTAGSTFTGKWQDVTNYAMVGVVVNASHASATDGVKVEYSTDAGSTVVDSDAMTHPGSNGDVWTFGLVAKYARVRYVNGGTNQTSFHLQVSFYPDAFKVSSHRIGGTIDSEDDAELSKVVIAGQKPDLTYGTAALDDSNRLIVTDPASAASGGFNYGIVTTSGTTEVSVRKTTYTEQSSNAQRSVVSSSVLDTALGTGARTVKITYYTLTGSGPFTEVVTLNGIVAVNTVATNICFVEKIEVVTAGALGITGGTISLKAAAAGLGATIGTIATGDQQTFWGHHYVPLGVSAYITGISLSNDKSAIDAGAVFRLKSFPIGVTDAIEKQVTEHLRYFAQDSTYGRTYHSPIVVQGPARLTAYVVPDNGTTMNNRCAFDFYEQDD